MNRLVKCTLVITVCYVSIAGSVRADELRRRLAGIYLEKEGVSGDIEKLERRALDLLDEYNSPADQGRIYAHIAHVVYGQTGPKKDPDKRAEYCRKALEYPLDVVTAAQMYGTWGGALWSACRRQLHSRESPWNEFPDVRREIAALFLRGMKLILDQGPPAERQPLPTVGKFKCRPVDSQECQDMVKEHQERRRARARVMLENDLVDQRKILTQQCVDLYSAEPVATEELAAIAREILGDEDAVAELLARLASRIKDKAETDPTKRDD